MSKRNQDASYTSFTDLLTADQLAAVGKATNTIAEHLNARPTDWAHPESATRIYQLPLTFNQLTLLNRLLAPALSEGYSFEGIPSSMVDSIHQTIRTVQHAASTGMSAVPFASLYRVHRAYGGPEEGGWWYNHWSLDSTVALDTDSDDEVLALLTPLLAPLLAPYQNAWARTPEEIENTRNDNILRIYHKWLLDESNPVASAVYREYHASGEYEHQGDWNYLPMCAHDLCVHQAPIGDDSIWLVFEWHPGMVATYERPRYC